MTFANLAAAYISPGLNTDPLANLRRAVDLLGQRTGHEPPAPSVIASRFANSRFDWLSHRLIRFQRLIGGNAPYRML